MTNGPTSLRRQIYAVLILIAFGTMVGRTLSIGPEASGGNDRSRWATIRALVDNGTYEIGRRDANGLDSGIMTEPGWVTNDKVMNPETKCFYSSKPPLLPTVLAGEYWLIEQLTGWTITPKRNQVQRTILIATNCLPLAVMLVLIAGMAERFVLTDWAGIFVVAAAGFATFLTTFAVVLNNHTVAACAVTAAIACSLRSGALGTIGVGGPWWAFIPAGFFAGFAACMDLPATAFAAGLGGLMLLRAPGRTLIGFVPAALVPVAALLVTNYCAIGQLSLAYSEFGGPWYNYPGSVWINPKGIDSAGNFESKWGYALHTLIGHHGLFSLTPIFILAIVGIVMVFIARRRLPTDGTAIELRAIAALTALLLLVVAAFYIWRTSNYGGRTGGPRWFFWLTPLFLICMMPALDRLAASRTGRITACILLCISAASAAYPAAKPWTTHPWLYEWMVYMGWIPY